MYALPHGPNPMDATIGECGAMNLMFVFDRSSSQSQPGSSSSSSGDHGDSSAPRRLEVVTPPLDGTILPGVTRASVLELLLQ
jgi:branched-subunit amino acid aminotransferase/4-amino-4-deoxychorismate lyase